MLLQLFRRKERYPLGIHQFESQESRKKEYLILHDGEAAAIDAEDSIPYMGRILAENSAHLKYLFITHAHPSHLRSLPEMKKRFGGTFCMHKFDREDLRNSGIPIEPDLIVTDNEKLLLGKVEIRVLHTPGHTKGSLCYWAKNAGVLFSGSTLLKNGYGQIWGNASMSLMLFSLKRLNYTVPSQTTIYPRTGEPTTMGNESWLNCLRSH